VGDDVGESSVDGAASVVSEVVRDRLVSRSCAWCGEAVTYSGRGRPPRFCKPSHRKRANELEHAQRRADAAAARGERIDGPVREVVERTTVRTVRPPVRGAARTVVREPALPGEWQATLQALVEAAGAGSIPPAYREGLASLADTASRLLRASTDGPQLSRAERRRREREARKRRR
jgi:hypothetical protein